MPLGARCRGMPAPHIQTGRTAAMRPEVTGRPTLRVPKRVMIEIGV
jgi:hypothetical protein